MSGTILLADDSLTIQKVVELTFADTDYRVIAVSSGDELLERLGDSQPDLIICDVIMPGRDGYDICQQIKSSSEWLHLPVILLTGTFEPFDRDRAIAAGCSEIITKPFEARKLVDTVERLIGSSDIQTPQPADDRPAASGEGETWPEEATPVDVPAPAVAEEFGTQLSAPATENSSIEFTTSGFAEMEAAGHIPSDPAKPDSRIEYKFGSADADEFEQTTPSADPPAPSPDDVSAQTVRIDVSSIREEETPEEELPPPLVEPEIVTPAPEAEPTDVSAETAPTDASAETAPGPFEAVEEEPSQAPEETETDEETEGAFKDESSKADTSPVDPPPEDSETAEEITSDVAIQLTEEDIDRIARRVVELAADRLDQIAWEVVPDMAEIVVRQRIRELEAESEASAPDPVQ